jgi:hypothetical protein
MVGLYCSNSGLFESKISSTETLSAEAQGARSNQYTPGCSLKAWRGKKTSDRTLVVIVDGVFGTCLDNDGPWIAVISLRRLHPARIALKLRYGGLPQIIRGFYHDATRKVVMESAERPSLQMRYYPSDTALSNSG